MSIVGTWTREPSHLVSVGLSQHDGRSLERNCKARESHIELLDLSKRIS